MIERISVDPSICGGQACIKGTRVPVYAVLDFLGAGNTIDEILAEYPQITREDIRAALEYASLLAREDIALASG